MSRPPLVIWGAGGHAVSVAGVALAAGWDVLAFVDPARVGETCLSRPVLASLPVSRPLAVTVAIGDNAARERVALTLASQHPDLAWPALVHPAAVVAEGALLDEGVVIMPGAVIGPLARAGRWSLINTRAVLEHESELGQAASLAPGAITGGRVRIGARSAVCLGSVVREKRVIGEDAVLGAASYLHHDQPACTLAWGTPATVRASRLPGSPYLD